MTFVIGAGPTGAEMAALIAEFCRETLATDRDLNRAHARIIFMREGKRVLAGVPADLLRNASVSLGRLGVEIHSGTRTGAIEKGMAHPGGQVWTGL